MRRPRSARTRRGAVGGGRGGRAATPAGRSRARNRNGVVPSSGPGFVDLFGGAGGMSLGFEMAGFRPLATLDSFAPGNETYRRNFSGIPPESIVCADAGAPGAIEDFVSATGLRRGDARVVIGGPPCQGFSVAGRVKLASLGNGGATRRVMCIGSRRSHPEKNLGTKLKFRSGRDPGARDSPAAGPELKKI